MIDCPFCKILTEKKERILKQSEHAFVVLSDPRLMLGHMLVIPKKHGEKFSDLDTNERNDVMNLAVVMQEFVLKNIASGCDISEHYRPFIKQNKVKVDHLHVHVRPRELEDELYEKVQKFEKDVFQDLSEEEFQKFKKLIFSN